MGVVTFCEQCRERGCWGEHERFTNAPDKSCPKCGCPAYSDDTSRQARLRERRTKMCGVLGHMPVYDDVNPYHCHWCFAVVQTEAIACPVPHRWSNDPLVEVFGQGCGMWIAYEKGRRYAHASAVLKMVRHVVAAHAELATKGER